MVASGILTVFAKSGFRVLHQASLQIHQRGTGRVVPFDKIDLVIDRLESVVLQESALESRIAEGLSIPEFAGDVLNSDRVHWVE